MPHFSIVIPTYNRAELLRSAIKSVLQQTFEDFEIVVSNGGSTDHTREVVAAFEDPRVRYLESEVQLPIGDNYQTGLDNAIGEYITFLSDDDAYTPELLSKAATIIRERRADMVGYRYCRYYHDRSRDFDLDIPKNSLLIERFSGRTTTFSSEEALRQVLAMHALSDAPADSRFICPYLSNATYKRSIFDSLRKKRSNLFDMVPADIYLAAAVFLQAESYHCLDEPLLVWSSWEGNTTGSAHRLQVKVRDHYRHLLQGRSLDHTPLKFPLPLNSAVNTVLEALSDHSEVDVDISWPAYYARTLENFTYLKSFGIDMSLEEEELASSLAQQPDYFQREVQLQLPRYFNVKSFINAKIPALAARLRHLRNRRANNVPKIVRGDRDGFKNVLEASAIVFKTVQ